LETPALAEPDALVTARKGPRAWALATGALVFFVDDFH
jgi:hypothetical protein